MLPQEPGVRLGASQTGTVDPGLLPGAHADGLAVIGKAHGIGLGVFQSDQGHDQVDFGTLGELFVFGDQIRQQRCIDLEIIPALPEGDAIDHLGLLRRGNVGFINGDNVVIALALGLEDRQSLLAVAGGDDAIGNLPGDELGGGNVADIGKGHPVTEGAHPVRTPGPGIGTGQRAFVQPIHVVYKAGLFQILRQHLAHCGRGGRHMLEGGHGAQARCFLQFLDQLIGIQGIQEVDVAGAAVEHRNGQIRAVSHIDRGGLLVGVAAIFQFEFFHGQPPYS